jgi:IS5 family transposase
LEGIGVHLQYRWTPSSSRAPRYARWEDWSLTLHGQEQSLHGDSAYHSKELQAQSQASGIAFNVNERGTRTRPLSQAQRARNRRLARVRAIGEPRYLVVKRLWGHVKTRYRGIAKNLAQMRVLFGLAQVCHLALRLSMKSLT